MYCYYIQRVKVSDLQNKRFPLWEEIKGTYPTLAEAQEAADAMAYDNPGYRYEVEVTTHYND